MTDVVLWAPKFPPDVGGASVYFEQVVRVLEGSQYRAHVFAPQRPDSPERSEHCGAEIYRVFPQGLLSGARFVPGCTRLLRQISPVFVHVHPHFPQWRFYRWLVKAIQIPRVYDCRDRTFKTRYVKDGEVYLSAAKHIDERLRECVGVSEVQRSPVVVEVPDALPAFEFDTTGPNIAFVGDLTKAKGIHLAIGAMEASEANLHIFGDGPQRESVAQSARSADWLTYHGPVEHTRALAAIQASDALVLPSKSEGRPRVVLEACKLGTPVVACDVGDIELGDCGLVVERTPEAIRSGLRSVLGCDVTPAQVGNGLDALEQAILASYQSVDCAR